MIDAAWMESWVSFVMGTSGPPGPISNYNLFVRAEELSHTHREGEVLFVYNTFSCIAEGAPNDIHRYELGKNTHTQKKDILG